MTTVADRDRTAIVGIGQTDFSKSSGRSELTLATESVLAALADAGLGAADVDGIIVSDYDTATARALCWSLGLSDLSYWGEAGIGGVAPAALVGQAVSAIVSGRATTVVIHRTLNGRSGRRLGKGSGQGGHPVGGAGTYDEFFLPYGATTPGQFFAMVARRYMIEHGLTHETMSRVSVTCRARANANPAAMMHDRPLTLDEAESARMISDPLRLYDFCLETDGSSALVITSVERAADLRQPPVLIRSAVQAMGEDVAPTKMFGSLLRPGITSQSSAANAERLYRHAGLGPQDVDVAQVYDCFTITALLQLADYGFCNPKELNDFVLDGNLDLGGAIPINTAGGHLSEAYIHGMNHIVEGVRQIRGTSTSQVEGAEVCLVTSAPQPGTSAILLRQA